MKLGSKEHYEAMQMFEKSFKGQRFDKEPKDLWKSQNVYQDGRINELFKAYLLGMSFQESITR